MDAFDIADLLEERTASGRPYLEFQRSPDLSTGLYVLPAGGVDRQQPHTEDEIYLVLGGRGAIRVAGDDRPVARGAVVFVAAGVEHHFHSIEEELQLFVAFGPAEGARARHARPVDVED